LELLQLLLSSFIKGNLLLHFFAEALSQLNAVISDPNAHHSDNTMAYDNAVSALGKICEFHRDSIDAARVLLSLYM
jgi:hypothetical protein